MCGIVGIVAYGNAAPVVAREELRAMRDHMATRGPDGLGEWISPADRVAFGHRRLAIIDLSDAAAQPMASADGKLIVTFNGEIYNYLELRRNLEAAGHRFRSHGDTEVLLHLYAEHGAAMVRLLRGMFAFAIWDIERERLFMARDPYGIKPLYYADTGGTLRFASQVKALLAGGAVSRAPEPAGQVGFYLWGSVPEPFTLYRDIRALPAGCTLTVSRGRVGAPLPYYSIAQVYLDAQPHPGQASPADAQWIIREALLDSVRHHLLADVPVGAFLSAGIDSGALVGLMRDAGAGEIQTLTLAFDEFQGRPDDESPLAAEIARCYGTCHTNRTVTAHEFQDDLPRILDAMDQPSIDGINSWFVAKAAHELGLKVAVSGVGGDELFGGYPSFTDVPRWVRRLALPSRIPGLGRALRRLTSPLLDHAPQSFHLSSKALSLLEYGGTYPGAYLLRRGLYLPWELDPLMDGDSVREGLLRLGPLARVGQQLAPLPGTAFARVATLESALYMRNQLLRDTDWASMAHSLEIRVPLVDSILLERVAAVNQRLSGDTGKRYLAEAPTRPLPAAVIDRKKTGFGIPVGRWVGNQATAATRSTYGYTRDWAQQLASLAFDRPVPARL
ncbi:asparagine synthase (glutamine-hydrolyzing) [uncultured Thiodictyon sp.]|uniref:asparagine synthase (glutamine-hydrolyzing) n=1 Tax=uncultured Thiodictyon sp. TaxID=1846217 RepID=UPI0025F08C6A|nr:asparagine synthase (glutamine-hydrolyzing) [uncultured Thiodictyon sp.]